MRWVLRNADPEQVRRLALETNLPTWLARLLAVRGIESGELARKFLAPSLQDLHDPYLMLGLRAAVERLKAAIERAETVLIYGDYDVDGTTAIVILKTALELCGGKVEYHVPHRIREGYGMRDEVIEQAADRGIRLIISVDTGIRAFAAAETAARRGLDLIVTDHHLPQAEGVPRPWPSSILTSTAASIPASHCAAQAWPSRSRRLCWSKNGRERLLPSFLKIVAIATIADAVP